MISQSPFPYDQWLDEFIPKLQDADGNHINYIVYPPGFAVDLPRKFGSFIACADHCSSSMVGAEWAGSIPELHFAHSRMGREFLSAVKFYPDTLLHLWIADKHFVFHCSGENPFEAKIARLSELFR